MSSLPNPQPCEFWATSKGRTVEILARDEVEVYDALGYPMGPEADVVVYKFLGGSQVHIRAIGSLAGWQKVEFD